MLIQASPPGHFLIELADLRRDPPPEAVREHRALLEGTVAWAAEYLCRPHERLGRPGPVCPFVHGSLEAGLFFLALCPAAPDLDAELDSLVAACRDWFPRIEPREGPLAAFKTILILFPGVEEMAAREAVEDAQRRFRPRFAARRMMIGEFHPGPPEKPGLRNPDFRALWSPVPLLAIRHMVATDFLFLRGDRECMAAYLTAFGHAVQPQLRTKVEEYAAEVGLALAAPAAGEDGDRSGPHAATPPEAAIP